MVGVLVGDVPGSAQGQVLRIRHDDQRDARAVAEEVDGLDIAFGYARIPNPAPVASEPN